MTTERVDEEWLVDVASAAAADARAPADLLGTHLRMLADAAINGRRPGSRDLAEVGELGRRAAEQGLGADRAVDLYLSAAWRLWRELPRVLRSRDSATVHSAAEALLRVIADAVAVLVDGHQSARRDLVRREESLRRDFVDDLLRGDASVAQMVERAEPFGLDLGLSHQVLIAATIDGAVPVDTVASRLERVVVEQFGDRDVLIATKEGKLAIILPGVRQARTSLPRAGDAGTFLHEALERLSPGAAWLVGLGRPYPGAYGASRSYEEAREAFDLAQRLKLDTGVARARDLLIYRVVIRDRVAIVDLVESLLGPLAEARGGAEPLVRTLQAYFGSGGVATEAARQLGISVRAVTYRLAKVKSFTGQDPADPDQRFALHAAVLGARLLGWPEQPLPDPFAGPA